MNNWKKNLNQKSSEIQPPTHCPLPSNQTTGYFCDLATSSLVALSCTDLSLGGGSKSCVYLNSSPPLPRICDPVAMVGQGSLSRTKVDDSLWFGGKLGEWAVDFAGVGDRGRAGDGDVSVPRLVGMAQVASSGAEFLANCPRGFINVSGDRDGGGVAISGLALG